MADRATLVAHRGYPARYPENSLSGIAAALQLGAAAVEFDIQLSGDRQPFVLHDARLERTTRGQGDIRETSSATLMTTPLKKHGHDESSQTVPPLSDVVGLLSAFPKTRVFVELKSESLTCFGRQAVIDRVIATLAHCQASWVLIASDLQALQLTRPLGLPVGWVLPNCRTDNRRLADACEPEYLISNYRRLPSVTTGLWPGPWQWMAYTANDRRLASKLSKRGLDWVETDCIGTLM